MLFAPTGSCPWRAAAADGAVLVEGDRIAEAAGRRAARCGAPGAPGSTCPAACSRPASSTCTRTSSTPPIAGSATASRSAPGLADHTARTSCLGAPRCSTRWRGSAPPAACARASPRVVDAAYSGDAVAAFGDAGLRAIVALEAFGGATPTPPMSPTRSIGASTRSRPRPGRTSSSRSRRTRPSASPRTLLRRDRRPRACARPARRHAPRRVAPRARRRAGGDGPLARSWARSAATRCSSWPSRGLLGPETVVAHAVHVGRRGAGHAGRDRLRRRPLPALERPARLRRRPAARAARGRHPPRPGHRQPRLGAVVRHLRRDARGAAARTREARPAGALGRRGAGARHARRGERARPRRPRASRARGCSPT